MSLMLNYRETNTFVTERNGPWRGKDLVCQGSSRSSGFCVACSGFPDALHFLGHSHCQDHCVRGPLTHHQALLSAACRPTVRCTKIKPGSVGNKTLPQLTESNPLGRGIRCPASKEGKSFLSTSSPPRPQLHYFLPALGQHSCGALVPNRLFCREGWSSEPWGFLNLQTFLIDGLLAFGHGGW